MRLAKILCHGMRHRWTAIGAVVLLGFVTNVSADIVVGAFDGSKSHRPLDGSDYSNLRGFLLDPGNFGVGGIVEESVTFAAAIETVTAADLAGYDVFFITEVNALSEAEIWDIADFVTDGGCLTLVSNSDREWRPGAHLMLQELDGGEVIDPVGGNGTADAGSFVGAGESTNGPFALLGAADDFAATPGSTLVAGSLSTVIGATAGATFDLLLEIPPEALMSGSGGVLAMTDVLLMNFFVPPAPVENVNNANLYMNWLASCSEEDGGDGVPTLTETGSILLTLLLLTVTTAVLWRMRS